MEVFSICRAMRSAPYEYTGAGRRGSFRSAGGEWKVSDALGRLLKGAESILQRGDGQIVERTKSGPTGEFEFADVRPGTYAVIVNKTGFATATSIVTVTARGATRSISQWQRKPHSVCRSSLGDST